MPILLTVQSVMVCPHGGTVKSSTANQSTRASNDFVLRDADTFVVTNCRLNSPCVQVKWSGAATRCKVGGDPVLNEASLGQCVNASNAVQGVVTVVPAQFRAMGV